MVAYGFNTHFIEPIRSGVKRHTIRLPRKRHARPGEYLQLFVGMRSKHCLKIMDDPVCTRVGEIRLEFGSFYFETEDDAPSNYMALHDVLSLITVDGIPLTRAEAEALAIADGFRLLPHWDGRLALLAMSRFWTLTHGTASWEGVIIHWEEAE